jgi:hypothetical protein
VLYVLHALSGPARKQWCHLTDHVRAWHTRHTSPASHQRCSVAMLAVSAARFWSRLHTQHNYITYAGSILCCVNTHDPSQHCYAESTAESNDCMVNWPIRPWATVPAICNCTEDVCPCCMRTGQWVHRLCTQAEDRPQHERLL